MAHLKVTLWHLQMRHAAAIVNDASLSLRTKIPRHLILSPDPSRSLSRAILLQRIYFHHQFISGRQREREALERADFILCPNPNRSSFDLTRGAAVISSFKKEGTIKEGSLYEMFFCKCSDELLPTASRNARCRIADMGNDEMGLPLWSRPTDRDRYRGGHTDNCTNTPID